MKPHTCKDCGEEIACHELDDSIDYWSRLCEACQHDRIEGLDLEDQFDVLMSLRPGDL
jgi:predicted Zn-ribbon and HTH transcriptional regulator